MSRSILIATSSTLSGGGIGSFCTLLCESLSNQGYDPIVVSPPLATGKSWYQCGARASYAIGAEVDPESGLHKIDEIIKRHRCLGALNNDHPYVQAYAPLSPVPIVSICHFDSGAIGRLAIENAPFVDYIVAISEDMRMKIASTRLVAEDQLRLVHTGIAIDGLSKPHSLLGRTRTLFLGGGDRRKGADLVERLALKLGSSGNGSTIEWYGHLGEKRRSRLSKLPSVRLMGHQPREEVITGLSEARFLLFPSRAEGCPMALLEAMGMGVVPICAAGRGAMKEIVTDNLNGFIGPLNDWVSNAHSQMQKEHSEEMLARMSIAARDTALRRFNIDQKANELVEMLRSPRVYRRGAESTRAIHWHRVQRESFPIGLISSFRFRFGVMKRGALVRSGNADQTDQQSQN